MYPYVISLQKPRTRHLSLSAPPPTIVALAAGAPTSSRSAFVDTGGGGTRPLTTRNDRRRLDMRVSRVPLGRRFSQLRRRAARFGIQRQFLTLRTRCWVYRDAGAFPHRRLYQCRMYVARPAASYSEGSFSTPASCSALDATTATTCPAARVLSDWRSPSTLRRRRLGGLALNHRARLRKPAFVVISVLTGRRGTTDPPDGMVRRRLFWCCIVIREDASAPVARRSPVSAALGSGPRLRALCGTRRPTRPTMCFRPRRVFSQKRWQPGVAPHG